MLPKDINIYRILREQLFIHQFCTESYAFLLHTSTEQVKSLPSILSYYLIKIIPKYVRKPNSPSSFTASRKRLMRTVHERRICIPKATFIRGIVTSKHSYCKDNIDSMPKYTETFTNSWIIPQNSNAIQENHQFVSVLICCLKYISYSRYNIF